MNAWLRAEADRSNKRHAKVEGANYVPKRLYEFDAERTPVVPLVKAVSTGAVVVRRGASEKGSRIVEDLL